MKKLITFTAEFSCEESVEPAEMIAACAAIDHILKDVCQNIVNQAPVPLSCKFGKVTETP